MDLELEITRTTGRAARAPSAEFAGDLTVEDLAVLGEGEKGSKPPALKRLSERHHAAARLLAAGEKPGAVAALLNYDVSRVSILQGDPSFRELVAFYKREVVEPAYRDFHNKLSGLAESAVDLLAQRVEEDPDSVTTGTALEILKTAADRTGHGPSSTSTQVNVHVDLAERLARAREAMKAKVIERE